jgi:DNA invertase Pin-like site-specific DNA recombinase
VTKAVAYYRVSTAGQGRSGLGLEAQQAAVEALCASSGWTIIAPPFVEIESGKRNDRPELAKAIERCKVTGARLVIAKLDRLSRNAAFLMGLKDSGVDFVAADMPNANSLTVGVMALVAQQEAEAISQRTKDALQAAKARGTKLGNPNGAAALIRAGKGNAAGVAAIQDKAKIHAERLRPLVQQLRAKGCTSLGSIAKALNGEGVLTPRGAKWHASSVRNLLARLEAAA